MEEEEDEEEEEKGEKRRTRRKARNTMSTKARMREKIDTGYIGHSAEQAKDISQGAVTETDSRLSTLCPLT